MKMLDFWVKMAPMITNISFGPFKTSVKKIKSKFVIEALFFN